MMSTYDDSESGMPILDHKSHPITIIPNHENSPHQGNSNDTTTAVPLVALDLIGNIRMKSPLNSLPQLPLQFPEMIDTGINISAMHSGMWPPSFPPMQKFHRGHASLRVSLSCPVTRLRAVYLYAVGSLIIDGRKYRVQGWMERISVLVLAEMALLVTITEPVIRTARVEHLTLREVDGLDGEFHVGCHAILPSGMWRLYVVTDMGKFVSISPPTSRLPIHVDDDWELDPTGSTCVSLAELVSKNNPHQTLSSRPSTSTCSTVNFFLQPESTPSQTISTLDDSSDSSSTCSHSLSGLSMPFLNFFGTRIMRDARKRDRCNSVGIKAVSMMRSSSPIDDDTAAKDEDKMSCTMQPIRYATLPSRLESTVPVIRGVIEEW